MASGLFISRQIDGETMETMRNYFLGSKSLQMVTAAIKLKKKKMLLGRKVMPSLDSMLKSRDTTLLTMICLIKAMVFPVVVYGCESWTIKRAECQKIYAFEL